MITTNKFNPLNIIVNLGKSIITKFFPKLWHKLKGSFTLDAEAREYMESFGFFKNM